MSLKKYTFNEKRNLWLVAIEKQLMSFRFYSSGEGVIGYQEIINKLFAKGFLPSELLLENVKEHYGYSENDKDIEYKLVKILTLLLIVGISDSGNEKILINNSLKSLKKYLPEYIISPFKEGEWLTYEATETKTVTENLNDIPEILANPISELLSPMKNENELIGLISKVYKDIEKVKPNEMKNLNEIDKGILKRSKELAKMLVNNVTAAKGHNGESKLKIKDIAHNFALNASLVQKLIQINKDNG